MFKFECTFEQFIQIATSKHWRVAAQAVREGEAAVFDGVKFVYQIDKGFVEKNGQELWAYIEEHFSDVSMDTLLNKKVHVSIYMRI